MQEGTASSVVERSTAELGPRALKTRARILTAAQEHMKECGFADTTLQSIAERCGCSRPTIYQYFKSKDELFLALAELAVRDFRAHTHQLAPITNSEQSRQAFNQWVLELQDLQNKHRVALWFSDTAAVSNPELAQRGAEFTKRLAADLADRVVTSPHSRSELTAVFGLYLETSLNLQRYRWNSPFNSDAGSPEEPPRTTKVQSHLSAAVFRALFSSWNPGTLPDSTLTTRRREVTDIADTRERLLEAATEVFSELGYEVTRVDDIVERANLSHGTFYRYFDAKPDIFEVVAIAAMQRLQGALTLIEALPASTGNFSDRDAVLQWVSNCSSSVERERPILHSWMVELPSEHRRRSAIAMHSTAEAVRGLACRLDPAIADPEMVASALVVLVATELPRFEPTERYLAVTRVAAELLQPSPPASGSVDIYL